MSIVHPLFMREREVRGREETDLLGSKQASLQTQMARRQFCTQIYSFHSGINDLPVNIIFYAKYRDEMVGNYSNHILKNCNKRATQNHTKLW